MIAVDPSNKISSSHLDRKDIQQTDLLIIGAGCSGLALARELSERQWSGSIILLDQRTTYSNDRTWCFWANSSNPWSQLASNHWYRWSMSSKGKTCLHHSDHVAYCRLQAANYYSACLGQMQQNPNLILKLNQKIQHITEYRDQTFSIETDDTDYRASIVVDTRPNTVQSAFLYQCFYGVELDTDWYKKYSSDPLIVCFGRALKQLYDDSLRNKSVGLMDDIKMDHQFNATVFQYLLPIKENEILIERTWFSPVKLSRECLQKCWQEYICKQISTVTSLGYQQINQIMISYWSQIVSRDEYGCLPMGIKGQNKSKFSSSSNYIYGGIAGNLLRPATGYGFLAIQSWANELAQKIVLEPLINNTLKSRNYAIIRHINDFLDHIFLRVIINDPKLSPEIFMAIINATSAIEFSQFMSNHPKPKDWWPVIKSVPKRPFVIGFLRVFLIYLSEVKNSVTTKLIGHKRSFKSINRKLFKIYRHIRHHNSEQHINKISTSDDRL